MPVIPKYKSETGQEAEGDEEEEDGKKTITQRINEKKLKQTSV